MSRLSPEARALIAAASRREALPSEEALQRARRSVLLRAASAGAAVAVTSGSSLVAKAAVAGSGWLAHIVPFAAVGAIAGAVTVASVPVLKAVAPLRDATTGSIASTRQGRAMIASPAPAVTTSTSLSSPAAAEDMPDKALGAGGPLSTSGAPALQTSIAPRATTEPSRGGGTATRRLDLGAQPTREPSSSRDLELQLELLREVRTALAAGHAKRAIELLDANQPVFPKGAALEEQYRIARANALCQVGRAEEARAEMGRVLARWPNSSVSIGATTTNCATASSQSEPISP